MQVNLLKFLRELPRKDYVEGLDFVNILYQNGKILLVDTPRLDIEFTTEGLPRGIFISLRARQGVVQVITDMEDLKFSIPGWKQTFVEKTRYWTFSNDFNKQYNEA